MSCGPASGLASYSNIVLGNMQCHADEPLHSWDGFPSQFSSSKVLTSPWPYGIRGAGLPLNAGQGNTRKLLENSLRPHEPSMVPTLRSKRIRMCPLAADAPTPMYGFAAIRSKGRVHMIMSLIHFASIPILMLFCLLACGILTQSYRYMILADLLSLCYHLPD